MIRRAIFFLLLFASFAYSSIGINSSSNVIIPYNDFHSFYINTTSNQHLSNVPNEFWSHNELCLNFTVGGLWYSRCAKNITWVWTNSTDNLTYASVNATASWTFYVGRTVSLKTQYYLNTTDSRIKITQSITYVGSRNIQGFLIWRVHDIKMNNTQENDYLYYLNASAPRDLVLNQSGLNETSTNVTNSTYVLHDSVLGSWAQTWWNSTNYSLSIYKNSSEYNAFVDLRFPFILTTGQSITVVLRWEDALCSWGCYMTDPTSEVTIQQDEAFSMSGYYAEIGGTCIDVGSYIGATFSNDSGTSYNYISTDTNLSTDDINPVAEPFASWTVTGKNPWTTKYIVRNKCYYNAQLGYSGTVNVEVTYPPPPPVGLVCTLLSANTNLGSDTNACYNITANNVQLNCNGKKIYSTNIDLYGVNVSSYNNFTMKNCIVENFTSGVWASNVTNITLTNNTFQYGKINTSGTFQDSHGAYLSSVRNATIINNTQRFYSSNRNSDVGGGHPYGIYLKNTNSTTILNFTSFNSTGAYNSGGGDPTIDGHAYGIFGYNLRNLSVTSLNVTNMTFGVLIGTGGGCSNCSFSKINIQNSTHCFQSYYPVNIIDMNGTRCASYGILLETGAVFSNLTNVILKNPVLAVGISYGIRISGHNTTIQNIAIQNATYGLRIGSSDVLLSNISVNFTQRAFFMELGKNITIFNATDASSNYSFFFTGASNMSVRNSNLIYGPTYINQIRFESGSFDIIFLNTTANYSNRTFDASGQSFTVQWYARVNVTDSSGNALTSTINVTNNQSKNEYLGYVPLSPYFIANDTRYDATSNVYFNNHYIIVNRSGYTTNSSYFNISSRDITINITLYATPVTSSCTYSGSGNWEILFSDKCNITSSQYLASNTITFSGTSGYVTFGNPTGSLLVVTAQRFIWNGLGNVYMWFKNSTWFNGTMGG